LLLVLPVEVRTPPDAPPDSTADVPRASVELLGGGGSYAIIPRDCQGRQTGPATGVPFREAAGALEVSGRWWRLGVRGGTIDTDRASRRATYLNPHVALSAKYAGLGAGPFLGADDLPRHGAPFSGHVWVGARRAQLRVSVMESAPLASGGGYARLGIRVSTAGELVFFGGLSGGLYEGGGFFANLDAPVHERVSLLARARLGSSGGQSENGFALGLRWYSAARPSP
jgi:hypothetical protein